MSSDESSLDTARVNKFLQNNKKTEDRPWWANGDDDSISDGGVGECEHGNSICLNWQPCWFQVLFLRID